MRLAILPRLSSRLHTADAIRGGGCSDPSGELSKCAKKYGFRHKKLPQIVDNALIIWYSMIDRYSLTGGKAAGKGYEMQFNVSRLELPHGYYQADKGRVDVALVAPSGEAVAWTRGDEIVAIGREHAEAVEIFAAWYELPIVIWE